MAAGKSRIKCTSGRNLGKVDGGLFTPGAELVFALSILWLQFHTKSVFAFLPSKIHLNYVVHQPREVTGVANYTTSIEVVNIQLHRVDLPARDPAANFQLCHDLFVDPRRPRLRHDIVAVELIDLKLDLVNLLRAWPRARLRGVDVLAMRLHGVGRRNRP